MLVLSKGMIAPDGTLPSTHVAGGSDERSIGCLGGPAHALEAVERARRSPSPPKTGASPRSSKRFPQGQRHV